MRKVDVSSVLGANAEKPEELDSCIEVSNLNLFYAKDKQALIDIDLTIPRQRVITRCLGIVKSISISACLSLA